jgi:mono/diheme cytochrome c family protein
MALPRESRLRRLLALAFLIVGACAASAAAPSDSAAPDPEAGRLYALGNCASCHNVLSRDPGAPPWRLGPSFAAVANEKTTTATGLGVFLQTPHDRMPNLIIPEVDRRNVIAYILTLKAGYRADGT